MSNWNDPLILPFWRCPKIPTFRSKSLLYLFAGIVKNTHTADHPETSAESVSSGPESSVTAEETEYDKVFEKYDRLTVEQALADALKNPRVAAWSPTSAMILNYFKSTRPRSGKSLSSEIDEILTAGLIKRYSGIIPGVPDSDQ